jgi:hypothetical protein
MFGKIIESLRARDPNVRQYETWLCNEVANKDVLLERRVCAAEVLGQIYEAIPFSSLLPGDERAERALRVLSLIEVKDKSLDIARLRATLTIIKTLPAISAEMAALIDTSLNTSSTLDVPLERIQGIRILRMGSRNSVLN